MNFPYEMSMVVLDPPHNLYDLANAAGFIFCFTMLVATDSSFCDAHASGDQIMFKEEC